MTGYLTVADGPAIHSDQIERNHVIEEPPLSGRSPILTGEVLPTVHSKLRPTIIVLLMGAAVVGLWVWLLGFRPSNPFHRKPPVPGRLANIPQVVLWAWEQPEDLNFLDPARFGVAYLAKTCTLAGDDVTVRPRLQPLRVPDGTVVIAVVRIETNSIEDKPSYSDLQAEKLISVITDTALARGVSGIQVDFDAKSSERVFYRNVLVRLRAALPTRQPLAITALASWCYGDDWISGLPIDEAIPMLFRMGVDNVNIRRLLEAHSDFKAALALKSVGISTDETLPWIPSGRHVYIFNPKSWTQESVQKAMDEIRQWE
jgi:hypothetical protein